jgi:hypothetical protein
VGESPVDTLTDNDAKPEEGTVSLEVAEQVRLVLADLLAKAPSVPPLLEGLPIELWLERIVPVAVASELMGGLTSETILKKYRDKLILLDGRKYGLRLRDALLLEGCKKKAASLPGAASTVSKDHPRLTSRNTSPAPIRPGGGRARSSK